MLELVACDPGIYVDGTVLKDGKPLVGAKVGVYCQEAHFSELDDVTTDAQGRFAMHGLGCLPNNCVVRAEQNEFVGSVAVGAGCKRNRIGCRAPANCNEASVVLQMRRK